MITELVVIVQRNSRPKIHVKSVFCWKIEAGGAVRGKVAAVTTGFSILTDVTVLDIGVISSFITAVVSVAAVAPVFIFGAVCAHAGRTTFAVRTASSCSGVASAASMVLGVVVLGSQRFTYVSGSYGDSTQWYFCYNCGCCCYCC